MAEREERIRRLRFRSWHRGTREMDLILGQFADEQLDGFSDDLLAQYEALLVENDPDIYNWITGRETPPAHVQNDVMAMLLKQLDQSSNAPG